MKRIDIFLETSIHGPTNRTGAVGYVAEYITEKGKEVTLSHIWQVDYMNEHNSLLTAAVQALTRVGRGNEIVLHTDACWMITSINEWMKSWERKGWVTEKGEEVKYKDLYEQLANRRKTDLLSAEKGITEKYRTWLQMQVQKKEQEIRCAK